MLPFTVVELNDCSLFVTAQICIVYTVAMAVGFELNNLDCTLI